MQIFFVAGAKTCYAYRVGFEICEWGFIMATQEMTITLPAELAAQVAEEAKTLDGDVSAVVKYALEQYLEEQKKARAFALEDDCND